MSTISELLTKVEVIHSLHEQKKKAEKARVPILHAEAVSLFKTCYAKYVTLQSMLHSTLLSQKDHVELSTTLAEAALYVDEIVIARLLVERFLQLSTPKDQFYCRIRIVFGLIIYAENSATNGMERIQQCKKAVNQVLQALEVATATTNLSRYKFLVYNASLAFWQIAREFIRPGRGSYFANEINTVIAAVEAQDDPDKTWRILLLSAGAICADDEKNIKNATDYVDKAIAHLEQLLSVTIAEETAMDRVATNVKNDVDLAMNAFRLIEERQVLMNKPRKIDPDLPDDDPYYTTPLTFPPLEGLAAHGREHVKELLDTAQKKKAETENKLRIITDRKRSQSEYLLRLYRQRIAVNAADSKKIVTLPQVTKDIRLLSMVQLQCLLTPNAVPEKEIDSTWTILVKKLTDTAPSEACSETLLDLSRTAWQLKQFTHAQRCMEIMQTAPTNITRILRAKLDISESLQMIYRIDTETQEAASKQLLSVKEIEGLRITKRMEAIKLLERTLSTNVTVIEDKFLIQEMCILLYNMLLPLLSIRHRHRVHSVLRVISTAMDEIDLDALPMLRSQVQYELALCEESADFAGIALTEVQNAYAQDYGDVKQPVNTADVDLLDINRLSDQFLFPFLQSLSLRIDVYANPSEAESQVLLWLQQAKESSSRLFIKDMITKSASLLFDEIETATNHADDHSQTSGKSVIDWSLVIMKKGKITISNVTLPELESVFTSTSYTQQMTIFRYSQQRYIQLLVTLARLAFSIEEAAIFNQVFMKIMSFGWNVSQPYAAEFIDDQIDILCKFAESVPWTIQKLLLSPRIGNTTDSVDSVAYVLGTATKETPEDIVAYKKLAIKACEKALTLAISREDSFLVHNVLIYFWNLHVHVFRSSYYNVMLEEVFVFVKAAVTTINTELFTCANIQHCCDPRLLLSYIESLASIFENRNQMSEALDIAIKGVNLVIPTLASSSSTACYYKKSLIEKASRLSVNMVIAANSGTAADTAGKGGAAKKAGGKGDPTATGSLDPITIADNPWLSLFAAITIAEFYPGSVPTLPKEALLASLDKANKLLLNEVKLMVDKEVDTENKNTILRTKECFDQRLEMQLECHARLSRLKILQSDFIAAQDLAEAAITFFQTEQLRVYSRRVDRVEEDVLTSRTYRWIACVEQYMSLAIISFLETANAASTTTLDVSLVSELQFAALQHLQPAINFSSWAKEEMLLTQVTSLVIPMLDNLLSHPTFCQPALLLCYKMVTELVSVKRSKTCQRIYRTLYLSMTQALIQRQSYDEALTLIIQAFDKLDTDFTKDLWPARVVCMSKKGLNVLDGLQKLKETDPLLQAQVLVLFARSSKSISNKLSVYQQVIELLDKRIERVDYVLELAEVLSSHGFPQHEIKIILQDGFATLCMVEENGYEDIVDWENGEDPPLDLITAAAGGNEGSVAMTKRATSTTSKSILRPGSSSVAKNNKGSAVSIAGMSNKANSIKNGSISKTRLSIQPEQSSVIEEDSMAKTLNFHTLELAYRTCIMKSRLCIEQDETIKELLMAVYFIQRSYIHWLTTLQTAYKQDEYTKFQLAKAEKVDFTSQQYLDFQPENTLSFLKVNSNLREVCFNDEVGNDEEVMKMTWQKQTDEFSLDLPSFLSLNNYNATIYHLFLLLDELLLYDLCYEAFFVCKYIRLLLWSLPLTQTAGNENNNNNNRNIALLALALKYRDIISSFHPLTFTNEQFLFTVVSGGEGVQFIQEGEFLNTFLQSLHMKHSNQNQDINSSLQYDLTFVDLLLTNSQQQGQGQGQGQMIEVQNQTFTSLLQLETNFYWMETLKNLHKNSSYVTYDMLIRVLLWEERLLQQSVGQQKKSSAFFIQISSFLLESLLMKGEYQEVIVHILARKTLLLQCGDVKLVTTYFRSLMIAYEHSEQIQEAIEIGKMLQALLEDLSIREIIRGSDGKVMVKSVLLEGDKAMMTKMMDASQSGLQSAGLLSGVQSTGVLSKADNNSKAYSVKEISKEVLQAWIQNSTYLAHLSLKSGLLKLQRQPKQSDMFQQPLQYFEPAVSLLNQAIEVTSRYFGQKSFQLLEILEMKINLVMRFMEEFHCKFSRYVTDEKSYAKWRESMFTAELIEYAKMIVECRLFWYERSLTTSASSAQQEMAMEAPAPASAPTATTTTAAAAAAGGGDSEPQVLTFGQVPPPSTLTPTIAEDKDKAPAKPDKPAKGGEIKVEKTEAKVKVENFPSVQQHHLGQAQLLLAFIQFYHAFITQQHILYTVNGSSSEKSATVIDRYLDDTEEHRFDDKSFFQVGIWPQIIALTEKAICNLTFFVTGNKTNGEVTEKKSELLVVTEMLSLAAQLANNSHTTTNNIDNMHYNIIKLTALLTTHFNLPFPRAAEAGKASYINPDYAAFTVSMDTGLLGYISRMTRSCVIGVLLECHHHQNNTWKCAEMNFLLQASNMHTLYLEKIWRDSLNPKCSVSVALMRCEQSAGMSGVGHEAKEKESVRVEREFLKAVSIPVRRLNVIGDTATALAAVEGITAGPRPPMIYLTLSVTPDGSCLYLSVGYYGTKAELDLTAGNNTAGHTAAVGGGGGKGGAAVAAPPAGNKKGDPATSQAEEKKVDDTCWLSHRLFLSESDRRAIQVLITQHQQWMIDAQKFVANYGDNLTEADELESNANTLNVPRTTATKAERALDETFKANLSEMTRIFTSMTQELASFSSIFASSTVPWGLQMFIDPHLQSLPWEAFLSSMSSLPFGHRICRDFSLSLLAHRVAAMDNTMTVQASSFRHAIDPFDEDSLGVSTPPRAACRVAFETQLLPTLPGGNKWQRLGRGKLTPTLEDLTLALDAAPAPNKATSLFIQPLARLSALLPLSEAASGAVQGSGKGTLKLLISLEAGHNEASFRRQNSGDVLKTIGEIEREGPGSLAIPALLSLSGVGSIATMQWSTPIGTQQRQMQQLLKQWTAPAKKERLLSVFGDPAVMAHLPPTTSKASTGTAGTPSKKGKEAAAHPIASSAVTAAAGAGAAEEKKRVKKWIAAARVLYGVSNLIYTDA